MNFRRILSKGSRGLFAVAVCWCLLIEASERFARARFGLELDGDWFLLLTGSSSAELREFLQLHGWPLAAILVLVLLAAGIAVRLIHRASRRGLIWLLAIFAAYVGWNCRSVDHAKTWKPVYLAYDTLRGARTYADIAAAGEWTSARAARVVAAPAGANNFVFVIGESMTWARLPFAGYAKNTLPRLTSLGDRLEVRGPLRAASPYTMRALPALFIADGMSAAVRYRLAGYRTAFIGAQPRWARYCSVESAVFAACESKIYLSELQPGEPVYDDQLLPHVTAAFAEFSQTPERPFALFIHLMGSHFDPAQRVRPDYLSNEDLDDYDRSLRLTDEVLYAIIQSLPPRTIFVYTSDHGESVDRPHWRDLNSAAIWQVPAFIYPAGSALPRFLRLACHP